MWTAACSVAERLRQLEVVSGADTSAEFHRVVLEGAWRLGSERGADGLTLRALATEINTNTTTIYAHFGDKAALMRALRGNAARRLASVLGTDTTTEGGVGILCSVYVDFVRRNLWVYKDETVLLAAPFDLPDREVFVDRARGLSPDRGDVDDEARYAHLWIAMRSLALLAGDRRDGSTDGIVAAHIEMWLRVADLGTNSMSGRR